MAKTKGANVAKAAPAPPQEIVAEPGFFGHVIKPGQSLVWPNEVEELALQLTSAALGAQVATGRSTLFATTAAKEVKVALCTLIPEKSEQWNLTHLFTPFDGPVTFQNEGANEIHLTGMIDVQDEDDEDDHGHHHGHDHDNDDSDDDEDEMNGMYSDSDDDDDEGAMVFGAGEDDDDDDEDTEDEGEGRFEVVEERLHGDAGEKKKAAAAAKAPAKKEPTPVKKEAAPAKKEATPVKKEATPVKKEAKKEATPVKKGDESGKKTMAEKVAEATGADSNNKKRAAPSEAVSVPKKAKSTREYKGVTIEDVAVGKGQPAVKGKKAKILYKGRLLNGKQFDASQNRKTPFVFRHGIGDVIKGMDIGIEGMRAGGKRTITIPSRLGYGKSGAPPDIPGNSTLVFEIELL